MKKFYAILLAMTLTLSGSAAFFPHDSYAASAESTTEQSTAEPSVDLISETSEAEPVETEEEVVGTSYGLDQPLSSGPDVVAESALLMDVKSGAVLYAKNADSKRYPASITKVMTALLAIERCKLDDIITFSSAAVNGIEPGSSTAGINVGAKITVEDALHALMLVSANEAGAGIAEHISGSNEEFAKLMTQRAKELGCTNTNFKNPHGLPDEEHYTTAHDMGLIMQEAVKHEAFRKISGTISYTIPASDTVPKKIELWNHVKILRENSDYYYKYAVGGKTGYTQVARNTLVTFAEKDDTQLLCIILKDYGADNSYYDSARLYKWGFEQVKTIKPLQDFDMEGALRGMKDLSESELATYLSLQPSVATTYPVLVKKDFENKEVKTSFYLDEDEKTGRLGYVDVKFGEEKVFSTPVTYDLNSDAAKNYLAKNDGGDDLQTVEVKNTDSILHKFFEYVIRIGIACILVYVIMQFIHRQQAEQKRKRRIAQRERGKQGGTHRKPASTKKSTSTRKTNETRRKRKR